MVSMKTLLSSLQRRPIHMAMHSCLSVANQILSFAQARGDTVTPMQLMKLVYLCHGWMLGIHGRQLVREPIEAWLYGPVIPDLYKATKHFKSSAVIPPLRCGQETYDQAECELIREVYDKYGMHPGPALSALTHQPGSPWHITWSKSGKNGIISNDLIESHYRQLAQNATPHPASPQLAQ